MFSVVVVAVVGWVVVGADVPSLVVLIVAGVLGPSLALVVVDVRVLILVLLVVVSLVVVVLLIAVVVLVPIMVPGAIAWVTDVGGVHTQLPALDVEKVPTLHNRNLKPSLLASHPCK